MQPERCIFKPENLVVVNDTGIIEHLSSLADPHILGKRLLEGPCSANKAAGNRQAIHRHDMYGKSSGKRQIFQLYVMTPDYHYPPVSSNMATENPSSIDYFPINSSIYRGFSWIFHYHIRFPEVFCQKLKHYLVGGFNPSEKYERSQLGVLFPIY